MTDKVLCEAWAVIRPEAPPTIYPVAACADAATAVAVALGWPSKRKKKWWRDHGGRVVRCKVVEVADDAC